MDSVNPSRQPAPGKKMPRWIVGILWGSGIISVMLVAGPLVLGFVADSRLKEALADLRKGGYATRPEEMASPPVPDTENAAPLYLEAFALCPGDDEARILEDAGQKRFSDVEPEERKKVGELIAE